VGGRPLNYALDTKVILDEFVSKLDQTFPQPYWRKAASGVVFPATCAEFGDIEITQEFDELIIQFGNFTHGHFSTAEDAISCLQGVFADEVEFYGSNRGGGGFCPRGERTVVSELQFGENSYVWSGVGV
jgi:hypothetical protein